jgi:hypothetical protein
MPNAGRACACACMVHAFSAEAPGNARCRPLRKAERASHGRRAYDSSAAPPARGRTDGARVISGALLVLRPGRAHRTGKITARALLQRAWRLRARASTCRVRCSARMSSLTSSDALLSPFCALPRPCSAAPLCAVSGAPRSLDATPHHAQDSHTPCAPQGPLARAVCAEQRRAPCGADVVCLACGAARDRAAAQQHAADEGAGHAIGVDVARCVPPSHALSNVPC